MNYVVNCGSTITISDLDSCKLLIVLNLNMSPTANFSIPDYTTELVIIFNIGRGEFPITTTKLVG